MLSTEMSPLLEQCVYFKTACSFFVTAHVTQVVDGSVLPALYQL